MEDAGDEPLFCERAAGIDIGKQSVMVTVRVPSKTRRGGRAQETREFGTTRRQLLELADWLRSHGVERAGMESTSDYWKPVFFLLEQQGLDCVLYHAAEDRAHTLGRPLPQTEVKITDPSSGQVVAPGETGELCTRGYLVIARARAGDWPVVLIGYEPVPRDWFPADLAGAAVLCLASGGGQQGPVLTEAGPVEISVPRDRDSSFEPRIVAKRQRRLTGVEDMVISLSAKGLTHGEIAAHLQEIYGAEVSKQTITAITDRVMDGMAEWQSRPLDPVYAVIFIDAIQVKIREGQVANRPVYLALGVTADGERDILGLWAGEHGDGEGAKFWLRVLAEIKNRGTRDVLMLVCDGLKGLPDAVNSVWDKTIVQTCIVHLLRNSFKYASKRDWAEVARDLKPVYTAVSEAAALDAFAEFSGKWEKRYPAIIRLWENAWAEFVPFLQFDQEIRAIISTTNAIESINARLRRAVRARGHFPTEQAALKCLYMALMSLDPGGKGRKRWTNRWKAALNAFDITFDGRLSAGRK